MFSRIAIGIDVVQQLLVVNQNFCNNNVRLILWPCGHVIQHEFMKAVCLCQLPMKLVVPQLMGTDDAEHSVPQILVQKNKSIAFDDAVHSF